MTLQMSRLVGVSLLSLSLAGGWAQAETTPEPAATGGCPSAFDLGFTEGVIPEAATTTVVKKVSRATVTQAQARRISMLNPVLSLVTVSGVTLRPIPGNSLWQLSNGGFAIFDSVPTVSAMETWTKDMGNGDLYVRSCACPGANPNVDDGCKFSDGANPTNPGTCGGNTCCDIIEGVILGNGTPIVF
jgi:hypothetical protein